MYILHITPETIAIQRRHLGNNCGDSVRYLEANVIPNTSKPGTHTLLSID